MRLFIGIDLPPHIKRSLFNIQLQLTKSGVNGSLKALESFHITLEFLGELPPESVPAVNQILKKVISDKRIFRLHLDRLGAFPSFDRPHTLWVGIGGSVDKLERIWRELHAEFEKNGFTLQKAPFIPHISLLTHPKDMVSQLTSFRFANTGNFTVSEIVLFESKVENGRLIYRHLSRAGLRQ